MLTVKQLARIANITPRTIRYYSQIGLLKPSVVHANGYRNYSQSDILRLQQILFYKELGMPLSEISDLLDKPGFDPIEALARHKISINKKIDQYQTLIRTIDETIALIKGEVKMPTERMFKGFTPEEEEKYAKEAEQQYDPQTVRESQKKWKGYGKEKQQQILDEGGQIYLELAKLVGEDPTAEKVQALVQQWRDHMSYFWVPDLDQLVGLGHLYNDDERFRKNFEQFHPDLAPFMLKAIEAYVAKEKAKG